MATEPVHPEPVLCNGRGHNSERPMYHKKNQKRDKWIKKMWYIYTMEYYSAIKRNEIGSFVETWMDLDTVIQSEVSQQEKNKYRI